MPPVARWTQSAQRAALRIAMGQAGILVQLPDTTVDEFLADALAAVNARAYLFGFGHFDTVAAQPTYTEDQANLSAGTITAEHVGNASATPHYTGTLAHPPVGVFSFTDAGTGHVISFAAPGSAATGAGTGTCNAAGAYDITFTLATTGEVTATYDQRVATFWIEPPRCFDPGSNGQADWSTLYSMPWEFDATIPNDRVDYASRPLNDDLRKVLSRLYATDTERMSQDWCRAAWSTFGLLEQRLPSRAWYDRAASGVAVDPTPADAHRIYWVAKVQRFASPYVVTDESVNGGTYSEALMAYALYKACLMAANLQGQVVKVETGTGKSITSRGGITYSDHATLALQTFARILPREWVMLSP